MTDLTRYRIKDIETMDVFVNGGYLAIDAQSGRHAGVLIEDTTLQDLADAWNDDDGMRWYVKPTWPALAALLDGLEGTDK